MYADGTPQERLDLPKSSQVIGARNGSHLLVLSEGEAAHLKLRLGNQAWLRLMPQLKLGSRIADIGSGDGFYSHLFRKHGHKVCEIDFKNGVTYQQAPWKPRDVIWCCHTLEHMRNPGEALDKMFSELEPGGLLAIVVPPAKHNIVGGHVTLWNPGLLLYHLVLARFDCREAMVGSWGYNIAVIVKKKACSVEGLVYDTGDIEKVAQYFPIEFKHGDNGQIGNVNWPQSL